MKRATLIHNLYLYYTVSKLECEGDQILRPNLSSYMQ